MGAPLRIRFLGHSSLVIEVGGRRFVTDPVLGDRLLHLRRRSAPVKHLPNPLDGILLSHLHHDHLDPASLRRLATAPVLVPKGGSALVERAGRQDIREVQVGDEVGIGGVSIEVVPAVHRGRRRPFGPEADAIGYVLEKKAHRIYFPGDTDIFDEMAGLAPLDVALMPIWGWGTSIGEGHLDPERAAEALKLLRPKVAIPIHWGTFSPVGTVRKHGHLLHEPAEEFKSLAAKIAPDVDVRVLAPGDETTLACSY